MDTNAISSILNALSLRQDADNSTTWMIVTGMIISAIAPTLAGVAAYLSAKAAKLKSVEMQEEVVKIHTAVNSERTAMLAEVKALRDQILEISKQKATLEEKDRTK
jgi:predicted nuclease with TOPRIM domain